MDSLEQTVQRERMEKQQQQQDNGTGDDGRIPNDADFNHPMIQKWWKTHQGRMRQLADKERELDRQMQQLAMMQQNGNSHAAGPQAPVAPSSEFEDFDPTIQEYAQQNPTMRALLKGIEKRYGSRAPDPSVSEFQKRIDALEAQLGQTQADFTKERYLRQIPEFQRKWGGALDGDQQQRVLQEALSRGIDLEDALFAVDRHTALAQERKRIELELRKQLDAEYGAALEGMEDTVALQPEPNRKPVGSDGKMRPFEETALDILGKGGMLRARRDGFDREEAVSQE